MSKTGQCGLNPSESRSLRSLKIACKALQNSRVTNRMVLFCFYAFSMSHGRAPIARPFTFCIIGVTVHDISRVDWSSVSHDRSSYGTVVHYRVLVARLVALVVQFRGWLDHRIRTGCKIWNDRAFPGWPSMCCMRCCTLVHRRVLLDLSDPHGVQDMERPCVPGLAFNALHAELHPRSLPGLS